MFTPVYIYALCDPRDGNVRYVGKSKNPKHRLDGHLSDARAGLPGHRANWVRLLLNLGLRPNILILEEVSEETWVERETCYIAQLRAEGLNLVNDTTGGEGRSGPLSKQARANMSAARKGKPVNAPGQPLSESHRLAIAKSLVGNQRAKGHKSPRTPEQRERYRKMASSPEGRAMRSAAAKKRWTAVKGGDA